MFLAGETCLLQAPHFSCFPGKPFHLFSQQSFILDFLWLHNNPQMNWASGNFCLVEGRPQESFFSVDFWKTQVFFSKEAHWELDWLLWPLWCPLFHISSSRLSKPFPLTINLCVGLTSSMALLGPMRDFMHMQKSTSFHLFFPWDRDDVDVVDFWLGACCMLP